MYKHFFKRFLGFLNFAGGVDYHQSNFVGDNYLVTLC